MTAAAWVVLPSAVWSWQQTGLRAGAAALR